MIDPELRPAKTVNLVACEVAKLGGELDDLDLKRCFSGLFQIAPDCCLFNEFITAYRVARQRQTQPGGLDQHPIDQVWRIAELISEIPEEALGYSE